MKALKILVGLFAVIGCLAIAAGGYYVYSRVGSGKLHLRNPINMAKPGGGETTPTETLKSTSPENNSILADYQKQMQTPAPGAATTPGTVGGPAPGAAPGQSAAQILAAKPIRTPDPSVKAIREWPTGRKWVALTFDDGPHPEWTPKFIDLLKSKGVKATFFLIGPNVEKHPEVAKLLADSGFEVANHTMKHPDFSGKNVEKVREEIAGANDIIKQVTGVQQINAFRPPYGKFPKPVQDVCAELGLKIVTWNVDTDDWRNTTNEDKMTSLVLQGVKDGAIILMHDRTEKAYNTTARIIDPIRAKGYEFVTVSELLGIKAQQAGAPAATTAAAPAADVALPTPAAVASAPAAAASTPAPSPTGATGDAVQSKVTTTPPPRK